jgi:hypothetical protein
VRDHEILRDLGYQRCRHKCSHSKPEYSLLIFSRVPFMKRTERNREQGQITMMGKEISDGGMVLNVERQR